MAVILRWPTKQTIDSKEWHVFVLLEYRSKTDIKSDEAPGAMAERCPLEAAAPHTTESPSRRATRSREVQTPLRSNNRRQTTRPSEETRKKKTEHQQAKDQQASDNKTAAAPRPQHNTKTRRQQIQRQRGVYIRSTQDTTKSQRRNTGHKFTGKRIADRDPARTRWPALSVYLLLVFISTFTLCIPTHHTALPLLPTSTIGPPHYLPSSSESSHYPLRCTQTTAHTQTRSTITTERPPLAQ
jgi:hypothetical protein